MKYHHMISYDIPILVQGRMDFVMRNSCSCNKRRWSSALPRVGERGVRFLIVAAMAAAIHGALIPITTVDVFPIQTFIHFWDLPSMFDDTEPYPKKNNKEINGDIISMKLHDVVDT